MNTESQNLLQIALKLPDNDRAELAASLFHSLDSTTETDSEQRWESELQRRISQIDQNEVELVSWESLMREMNNRKNG